jgi:hypothetical protein
MQSLAALMLLPAGSGTLRRDERETSEAGLINLKGTEPSAAGDPDVGRDG